LNDEANLNIYDAVFAAEQISVFDSDKRVSRRMTLADFENRSMPGKIFDAIAGVFRQQF
jgi:cardiolipin synthase